MDFIKHYVGYNTLNIMNPYYSLMKTNPKGRILMVVASGFILISQ
jgi:hypothetical protein